MVNFINPLDDANRYSLDDKGIGNAYADSIKDELRFVSEENIWYYYNGILWKKDYAGIRTREQAKDYLYFLQVTIKKIIDDGVEKLTKEQNDMFCSLRKLVAELTTSGKRKIMIDEAKSVHALNKSAFDTNKNLLNCSNCTIDLQTGEPREHDPNDFITKVASVVYDKNVNCPRWSKFINEIMCNDAELERFLQTAYGYGITGETSEECMFIEYGPSTRNGKGTLKESVMNVLGDYALNMQPNSLAKRGRQNGSSPTPDIARNVGVRFINVNEPAEDMVLDAAIVKQLTGSDTVTARLLYANSIDFIPQFKLYMSTNHLPTTTDDTLFTSGRINVIPFNRHFSENEQDHGLKSLFRTEESKSAILNWLLDGLMLYRNEGLKVPNAVQNATLAYRKTIDTVCLFIKSVAEKDEKAEEKKTAEVYLLYREWCADNKLTPVPAQGFVGSLRGMGHVKRTGTDGNVVHGLKFK